MWLYGPGKTMVDRGCRPRLITTWPGLCHQSWVDQNQMSMTDLIDLEVLKQCLHHNLTSLYFMTIWQNADFKWDLWCNHNNILMVHVLKLGYKPGRGYICNKIYGWLSSKNQIDLEGGELPLRYTPGKFIYWQPLILII